MLLDRTGTNKGAGQFPLSKYSAFNVHEPPGMINIVDLAFTCSKTLQIQWLHNRDVENAMFSFALGVYAPHAPPRICVVPGSRMRRVLFQ